MSDTEVEVYTEPAGSEIEQWARDLSQAYQMARQLVTTSFVPATYNGKPEEAAAAIITGAELGLSPLASLRSIDIIHGVPGMRAIALRALVQSHGHEIWTEEQSATRAIVKGRRKGQDKVETSTFTIERAQQLGLHTKDNWKKQPIAMLLARATSECARLIAADVLLGIPYSIEELEDLGDAAAAAGADVPSKPRATRKAQRAPLAVTRGEEPEPDGAAPQEHLGGDAELVEEKADGLPTDEDLAAAARVKAEKEFAERPPLDEPMVDWQPPADEAPTAGGGPS